MTMLAEEWQCPICQRVLHPRSAYDKKLHNGTRVHERAQVLLDKYHAMLAGVVTPLRASEITQ